MELGRKVRPLKSVIRIDVLCPKLIQETHGDQTVPEGARWTYHPCILNHEKERSLLIPPTWYSTVLVKTLNPRT